MPLGAQVQFEDATAAAGIDYVGESYGASVGYSNDDVLPDIFVSRHRADAALLTNLADGTFEDRAYEVGVWQTVPNSDQHGGSWADFDNDGDNDLTIMAGSKNFSQFLINNGTSLADKVDEYTWDKKAWGGRLPFWFDFTRDGLLDVAFAIQGQRFQLFEQINGAFQVANFVTGNECENNEYAHLADLTQDGTPEWICTSQDGLPQKIYDYSGGRPFVDRTSLVEREPNVMDSFVADLDGDLIPEFFGLRGRTRVKGAEIVDADSIEAHVIDQNGTDTQVTFNSAGDISVELHWNARNASKVFIGAGGYNPRASIDDEPLRFTLSAADTDNHGIIAYDPANDDGLYFGYDPATQTWTYAQASGNRVNSYTYLFIDSTAPVSNLNVAGLLALDTPRPPALLKFQPGPGTWQESILGTGLEDPKHCISTVAADFDNDMDQDIYMVCRDAVSNRENLLYLNDGSGNFTQVAGAGGAAGPVGIGQGLGEGVVVTDYDVDGFVDMFVTNGLKLFPEGRFVYGGPDKLYRNLGNSNNWVAFDLEGTTSNRDGVGAIVTVTAGGVQQRREQNGGYRRWSQNDPRLHFGLAGNTTLDVEVLWPSGQMDTYAGIGANGLYTLTEGASAPAAETIPTTVEPSACGLTAGIPDYDRAVETGLFIWTEDCGLSEFKLRGTGGAGPNTILTGRITSDLPVLDVQQVSFEGGDSVNVNAAGTVIDFEFRMAAGREDGLDLSFTEGAKICFGENTNVNVAYTGAGKSSFALPANLETLGPCDEVDPEITVSDVSAPENTPLGFVRFDLDLNIAVDDTVSVDYSTASGGASAPGDFTAASGVIEFAPGETSAFIEIPLQDDTLLELGETFALNLSNPVNAELARTTATATIEDDDGTLCGAPTFNTANVNALFVWQDCASGAWSVRATGGGAAAEFRGSLQTDGALTSTTPFGIEGNDTLDSSSSAVDFSLQVSGADQDGFDVDLDASTSACLFLDAPNTPVLVGALRNPLSAPFDLRTSGLCFPNKINLVTTQRLSSGDPSPGEGDEVEFTITVFNSGPGRATSVSLVDRMPAGLTLTGFNASKGLYNPASGRWDIGNLQLSESANLVLSGRAEVGQTGNTITNRSTAARGREADAFTAGDVLEASVTVVMAGTTTIESNLVTTNSLTSGDLSPAAGDAVSFAVVINNLGTSTATSIVLDTLLPAGLTYVGHTADKGSYDPATGRWSVGAMANGTTKTLSIDATVDAGQTGNKIVYATTAAGARQFDPTTNGDVLEASITVDGSSAPVQPVSSWPVTTGGVTVSSGRLGYSGSPTGWNNNTANSASLSPIGSGDRFEVGFTLRQDPTGTTWTIGLGTQESSASWRDVDFGFRSSGGDLEVREDGLWVTGGPRLTAGDRLSISVAGGSIEYRLNGSAIASGTYTGNPAFYVDSSFRDGQIAFDVDIARPAGAPSAVPVTNGLQPAGGVGNTLNGLSFVGTPGGWRNRSVGLQPPARFQTGRTYALRLPMNRASAASVWTAGRTDIDYRPRAINRDLTAFKPGDVRPQRLHPRRSLK